MKQKFTLKEYASILVLILFFLILVLSPLYMSYKLVFEFENFKTNTETATLKQNIYYVFVLGLNYISAILRYVLVVLQIYFSYKVVQMGYKYLTSK